MSKKLLDLTQFKEWKDINGINSEFLFKKFSEKELEYLENLEVSIYRIGNNTVAKDKLHINMNHLQIAYYLGLNHQYFFSNLEDSESITISFRNRKESLEFMFDLAKIRKNCGALEAFGFQILGNTIKEEEASKLMTTALRMLSITQTVQFSVASGDTWLGTSAYKANNILHKTMLRGHIDFKIGHSSKSGLPSNNMLYCFAINEKFR